MPKLLATKRKKVNFMVDEGILERVEAIIPSGERSDFVNHAMEQALIVYGRKKAFEFFQELPKKGKKKWTSDNIVKFIKNERKKRLL